MSNFQNALECYNDNKYDAAFAWFKATISEKDGQVETKLLAMEYLAKINILLKHKNLLSQIQFDLACELLEKSSWSSAYKLFKDVFLTIESEKLENLPNKIPRGVLLNNLWKSSSESGEIEDAKYFFNEAFWQYKKSNNSWAMLGLLENYQEKYPLPDHLQDEYFRLLLISGELAKFQRATNFIREDISEAFAQDNFIALVGQPKYLALLKKLSQEISCFPNWREDAALFEIVLVELFLSIYPKEISFRVNLDDRKRLINLLFEFLVVFPNNPVGILVLYQYGIVFSKRFMLQALIPNIAPKRSGRREDDKIFNALKNKKIDLVNMRTCDYVEVGDSDFEIDLGEDLFVDNTSRGDLHKSPTQLIHAIDYLIKSGNEEHIDKLMEELRKIDPQNNYLKELEAKRQKSFSNKANQEVAQKDQQREDRLVQTLENLIHGERDGLEEREFRQKEKSVIDHLVLQGREYICDNVSDLATAFLNMQMYSAVEFVVNMAETAPRLTVEEKVGLSYIKASALMEQKRFFDALAEVESVLGGLPLTSEEKKDFLYLNAELLYAVKERSRALKIYQELYNIDPNYRMVKNRIGLIESGK
ncbi:MAG: hypothetical protein A2504_06730 [Bdellovibrionales bacterium RIFOXYD12_FULL_39_22]|nr:MAG: hypothetical protein A2385_09050 [Bdellovibrionales bacterium RIFOXYB1_FULL_39_21]OFZ45155.1 MAG: hypothetical protein A2485_05485 [Bdellovibrionales bacterium RIFOXYC12_FULL_39_17]OFZ45653.1 MAG: hypothetical protein A2404_03630 [Bdellovibrionales bacterium RIFOXYC1_FULL_39_130]OFZ73835.1 MAG: hypothetical protein A2451_12285 [Bdellovibrionales bacterium RIFOXYC2_FULL_39_8]OFZ77515.1 MAG: hypothetical protein A2560_09220 [Bdellovibrionales bacterium RIFOXYD1_FULL_39_84]OFZ91644.1 MAG: